MQVCVALLIASILMADGFAAASQRKSKMPNTWRTQTRKKQGMGSYSIRGTAGGETSYGQNALVQARPTGADCTQPGFFPTPGSCLHFYRCVDWAGDGFYYSTFHFTCPVGTVFDDALDICNYPHAARRPECAAGPVHEIPSAGSQDRPSSTTLEPSVSTQEVPSTGLQDGFFTPDSGITQPGDHTIGMITQDQSSDSASEILSTSTTGAPLEQTSPGVFSLTCYPDDKYRRHPLYCNQYYYCVNDGVWSVPIFTCPRDLVFDEENQICTSPGSTSAKCDFAPYSTSRPSTTTGSASSAAMAENVDSTESTASSSESSPTDAPETTPEATAPPPDMTTKSMWEVDPLSPFDCPAPGYYPYEGDCIRFYKCVETDLLQLRALLYRCPDGFGYSEERQRCLKQKDLPPCQQVPEGAHIRDESATQLYPEDLIWFFRN